MNKYLTRGDVLPEEVPGMHWPVAGKTPQRLAVGRHMVNHRQAKAG